MIEVKSREYDNLHRWIHYHYGKASKCENPDCTGVYQKYEWALKKGMVYERNIDNFSQLCTSCHRIQDTTPEKREKMRQIMKDFKWSPEYRAKMLRIMTGVKKPNDKRYRRAVNQLTEDGEIIKTWPSLSEAARGVGLKRPSSIRLVVTGKWKHAKGYRWEYASEEGEWS